MAVHCLHPILILTMQHTRNSDNDDGEDNMKGRSFFEMSWTKKYDFFLHHGYELRPRYSPEWEPSWKTNGKPPQQCEDYHRLPVCFLLHDLSLTANISDV